jgi:hypothetical protein
LPKPLDIYKGSWTIKIMKTRNWKQPFESNIFGTVYQIRTQTCKDCKNPIWQYIYIYTHTHTHTRLVSTVNKACEITKEKRSYDSANEQMLIWQALKSFSISDTSSPWMRRKKKRLTKNNVFTWKIFSTSCKINSKFNII